MFKSPSRSHHVLACSANNDFNLKLQLLNSPMISRLTNNSSFDNSLFFSFSSSL
ncbi:hypothetical protein Fmac_016237 [Flemingia macrophylla]|uniref:Uncharacterized protein n=1 Tax=Flemingia macrophylla TaxID=520843 RepID=A0ABD1MGT9_9FABA